MSTNNNPSGESQSLTASPSPSPSYDATEERFTSEQINLLSKHDEECRSDDDRRSNAHTNRSTRLFSARIEHYPSVGTQEEPRSSHKGRKTSTQLPCAPPSNPQLSYYKGYQKSMISPRSDETYDTMSTGYSVSKHTEREILLTGRNNATVESSTQTMTIGTRHRMESDACYRFFSIHEDFDNSVIHIQKSFGPSNLLGVLFRFFFCHLTFNVLKNDYYQSLYIKESTTIMFFSHLTNITLTFSLLYQSMSTFLSVLAVIRRKHYMILHQPSPSISDFKGNQLRPGLFVCMIWLLYTIVLPGEFLVAIGYWIFDYDPTAKMTFINFYKHALIGLLLMFDGFVIARIPLRIKHWRSVFIYGTLYLFWSMIFSYYRMGKNDGIIYQFLDWRYNPSVAAAISILLMFVMTPLVFYFCWLVSNSDVFCCLGMLCGSFHGRRRHIFAEDTMMAVPRMIDGDQNMYLQWENLSPTDIVVAKCEAGSLMMTTDDSSEAEGGL